MAKSSLVVVVVVVMIVVAVPVMPLVTVIVTPVPIRFLIILVQPFVWMIWLMVHHDPLVILHVLIMVPGVIVIVIRVIYLTAMHSTGSSQKRRR